MIEPCRHMAIVVCCTILLGVLLMGCSNQAATVTDSDLVLALIDSRSHGKLNDFPKDVPVYPGLKGVTASNDHGLRTFQGLSEDSADAVRAYYEDALGKNGWTKAKSEGSDDGLVGLSYTKDGRRVTVAAIPKRGRFTFVTLCHFDAGASPEARRAAAQPDMPEAREVMDRMARTYAACASYRDKGVVTNTFFEMGSTRVEKKPFSTAFVRPDRFRFEYLARFPSSARWYRHIIHSDASGTRTWGNPCESGVVQEKSLELAIAGFMGISGGSSARVPSMLLPSKDSRAATGLFQLKRLPDEDLDGAACYRIEGMDDLGEMESLWIDKQSMLLRRVDESHTFPDFRVETVTTCEPEIGITIPQKELDFAPPAALALVLADSMERVERYFRRAGAPGILMASSASLLLIAACVTSVKRIRRRTRHTTPN